jgi:hypothetical protein
MVLITALRQAANKAAYGIARPKRRDKLIAVIMPSAHPFAAMAAGELVGPAPSPPLGPHLRVSL